MPGGNRDRVDYLVPQHDLQNRGIGVAAGCGGFLAVMLLGALFVSRIKSVR